MNQSESINELAAALAKAQAEIKTAPKERLNPHFRSHYADLVAVWDACREALAANGLSVVQSPEYADGRILVTTRLIHKSGQWLEGTVSLRPSKDDPQGAGSAITYGRRYALAAMVGVVADDDDGNAASQVNGHRHAEPVAKPAAPPAKPEPSPQWKSLAEWFREQIAECPDVWGAEETAAKRKIMDEAMLVAKTFGVDTTAALMACTRDEVFAAIREKLIPAEVGV